MIAIRRERPENVVFVTGATGMLGIRVLERLLEIEPGMRAFVLVRDRDRWRAAAARLAAAAERVRPVIGDLCEHGLGLSHADRLIVTEATTLVVHAAADTVFSRTLDEARAVNVAGTDRVLELADACAGLRRFVFVSTAFVAGRRVGRVPEAALGEDAGWVNPYEQSKHEAEAVVRAARPDASIVRSSTVVFDRADGTIPQSNAAHKALRLLRQGLVPMMPGSPDTPIDMVTADYVADGIARLATRASAAGLTAHLCAGDGALPLGDLLESSWEYFARDREWRLRDIPQPALVDLGTYRLFERTVTQTADAGLRRATAGLSHFIPHLGCPKRFETSRTVEELGRPAPRVADYWPEVLRQLVGREGGVPLPGAAA